MKKIRVLFLGLFLGATIAAFAGENPEGQGAEGDVSHDLFSLETTYTLSSDFHRPGLGHGDSIYNDFSYDHRFLIKGKWYFRTGFEYERFNFDGTNNGLPDHLQGTYGHFAIEYVVHDRAGAGFEVDPGVYFQDRVSWDAFDIPWKLFVGFPLKKDKIFAFIGVGGSIYSDPVVAPGGGIVWLFSDHLRLEGVFPKPALVYEPNDDWQFRLLGQLTYESFRTDDLVIPASNVTLHNAVLQYNEDRVGVQARYSGFKPFKIGLNAGCTFQRQFDFFRADVREKIDPAPYIKLIVEAKF
jgi:hypothetical protein